MRASEIDIFGLTFRDLQEVCGLSEEDSYIVGDAVDKFNETGEDTELPSSVTEEWRVQNPPNKPLAAD
jgi:hypothetical protein